MPAWLGTDGEKQRSNSEVLTNSATWPAWLGKLCGHTQKPPAFGKTRRQERSKPRPTVPLGRLVGTTFRSDVLTNSATSARLVEKNSLRGHLTNSATWPAWLRKSLRKTFTWQQASTNSATAPAWFLLSTHSLADAREFALVHSRVWVT